MERQHFVQQLETLKMTLLNMAALTRRALADATRAYLERDDDLAHSVIDNDSEINDLELDIDDMALRLLALEQPMAKDLRFILSSTKISNELERIADQAVNIAERTLILCQSPPLDHPLPAMEKLIDVVGAMLEKAISSLVDQNTKKAIAIRKMDELADQYAMEVLQNLIAHMVKSASSADEYDTRILYFRRSIIIIIISRCLERIGDMAINIGEQITFFVEGVNVKHKFVEIAGEQ
jgi:phosphate transport system protein